MDICPMSTLLIGSADENVRAKILSNTDDVPVFAAALRAKVNDKRVHITTSNLKLVQKKVAPGEVSGDPRSGQTLESPQTSSGYEGQGMGDREMRFVPNTLYSVPFLHEDPSLVRSSIVSDSVHAFLRGTYIPTNIFSVPKITVSPVSLSLQQESKSGLVDVAVAARSRKSWVREMIGAVRWKVLLLRNKNFKFQSVSRRTNFKQCPKKLQVKSSPFFANFLQMPFTASSFFFFKISNLRNVVLSAIDTLRLSFLRRQESSSFLNNLATWIPYPSRHLIGDLSVRNDKKKRIHKKKTKIQFPTIQLPTLVFPHVRLLRLTLRLSSLARWHSLEFLPNTLGRKKLFHTPLWYVGQVMTIGAIVMLLMTVGPIIRLQGQEWWQDLRVQLTGNAQEPAIRENFVDVMRPPDSPPPEDKQFQILVPKLGINAKVIPNVDASDEKAYAQALKHGVAHAAGSNLPGETNTPNRTVYIFGHSTDGPWDITKYNALFYSLKDLAVGDKIIIWFWGKEYDYSVVKTVKIDPSDISYLQPQTQKDQLILQTCWPPGTVFKRLLVIADPVSST
ncbi:hypothetical protein C5B42_06025 [Candidatus Cerribacteria bacterium 'Amazon FNV 2010 28 9']|uniref:Sortase n=1 Tax=Candidatus Cerribacteria bacterium 'Amazon FNV 2010 28 9' TaxID=2081795 RepID=A0A317JMR1_9BACT|nr:MAG: hypothetical protein C5B42_06025 [Candidatus Cerribacteria bacterium 'Amazon FNV 2010 28 9']